MHSLAPEPASPELYHLFKFATLAFQSTEVDNSSAKMSQGLYTFEG